MTKKKTKLEPVVMPLGSFTILPSPPDTCPECATKHDPTWPHNKKSLPYQMKFQQKHGRWPTWEDAMAHCSEEMKARWREQLVAHELMEGNT